MDQLKRLEDLTPEELARVYQNLFETDTGKLVLADLKNRACPDTPTVAEDGPIDPYRTHYNEGKRAVFYHILTQLNTKPEKPAEAQPQEE